MSLLTVLMSSLIKDILGLAVRFILRAKSAIVAVRERLSAAICCSASESLGEFRVIVVN